jgi:hypothetical protein
VKRSRGFRAEDLPEHIRRLNAGVLGDVPAAPIVQQGQETKSRQSERKRVLRVDKLNKTETRFLAEVRRRMMGMPSAIPELDGLDVWCYDVQPPRYFEFEDGDTYTPDFLLLVEGRGQVVVEVKGGYRGAGWEQGWERFKRAAEVFGRERGREFWLCEWKPRENRWSVRIYGNS